MRSLQTRIAPTPSGYLHQGNAFNFLLTFLWARQSGARVHLRIDDGDVGRVRTEYLHDIFTTLDWLDLHPDGGPSDLAAYWADPHDPSPYRSALVQLQDQSLLYRCVCSRKQLRAQATDHRYPGTCRGRSLSATVAPFAWRGRVGDEECRVSFLDFSEQNQIADVAQRVGDMVIWRKDDLPAYHLQSVVDDERMGITHIVRGADLYDSTVAQHWLASQLGYSGFKQAKFWHHPLITDAAGEKLSKSAGSTSLHHQRAQGQSRQGVYQAFLAWQGLPAALVADFQELLGHWSEHAPIYRG